MEDDHKNSDSNPTIKIDQVLSANLDDSFNVDIPPFDGNQKVMLGVFMILQVLLTCLTVSVNPILNEMAVAYMPSQDDKFALLPTKPIISAISIVACIAGFFPATILIERLGMRIGMSTCMGIACLGGFFCCFINVSIWIYFFGYFLTVFGLQGIHASKGVFVNLFFDEKAVFYLQ